MKTHIKQYIFGAILVLATAPLMPAAAAPGTFSCSDSAMRIDAPTPAFGRASASSDIPLLTRLMPTSSGPDQDRLHKSLIPDVGGIIVGYLGDMTPEQLNRMNERLHYRSRG